jgi:hypothetical protein
MSLLVTGCYLRCHRASGDVAEDCAAGQPEGSRSQYDVKKKAEGQRLDRELGGRILVSSSLLAADVGVQNGEFEDDGLGRRDRWI